MKPTPKQVPFFLPPSIRVSPIRPIRELPVPVKTQSAKERLERETAFDEMFSHAIAMTSLFCKSTFPQEAEAGRRMKVLLSEHREEFKARVTQ